MARRLARQGYVVLLVRYFERTGTKTDDFRRRLKCFRATRRRRVVEQSQEGSDSPPPAAPPGRNVNGFVKPDGGLCVWTLLRALAQAERFLARYRVGGVIPCSR
jgi:hypothetical protein